MYGTTSCLAGADQARAAKFDNMPNEFSWGSFKHHVPWREVPFFFFLSSLPDRRNTPPNETKTEIRDNYIYIYIDCTTWEIITKGAKKKRKRKELLGCCCCVSPIVFPSIHVYRTHLPRRALFFRGLFYIFLRDCHARSN